MVSYEHAGEAYTSLGLAIRQANVGSEKKKTVEESEKDQLLDEARQQAQKIISAAEKSAAGLLSEAENEAARIIEEADAKADRVEREAEEKGYKEGEKKAQQEMEAHLREKTDALSGIISEIGEARETMINELEDDIISLVIDTVRKVINLQLEKDDKVFVDVVQNALGQMRREGKIVIRVSQEEYGRLFGSGNAEFVLNNERVRATVIDEPLFKRGDCVIESDGETVNAGISSQLKYIELAFRSEESQAL